MTSNSNQRPFRGIALALFLGLFLFLIAAGFLILFHYRTSRHALAVLFTLISLLISTIGLILSIFFLIRSRSALPAQSLPAQKPDLPVFEKPRTSSSAAAAKEYQVLLDRLQTNISNVQARQNAVEKLIDDYFGESFISSSRYKQVMHSAQEVLEKNYENACRAVELFGSSSPTAARIAILQNYVQDSDDIVANIDRVIDELLKVQQSSVMESGDTLDEKLEELADTTIYYQKKEQN